MSSPSDGRLAAAAGFTEQPDANHEAGKSGGGVVRTVLAPSWSDFTQSTTFHGVRYIFDTTHLRFRRLIWVLCVVAAIATFILQVGMRAGDFFQYHTTVDVQVIYTNQVPFPVVTICNQNNFRLTKTVEDDLYTFIDYVYSVKNISELDISNFTLDGIDTRSFIEGAAHQMSDLIESCSWRGGKCNVSTDFTLTHTDMGACYTFNKATDESALAVTEPGAGYALSLIMNVEQYEYSRGPQNDAGVKILLHDQSEFPMTQDLGFAVAPGTHTLVGVHSSLIETMEEPYGTCNALSSISMSDCTLKCRTREIIDKCDCRTVYMPEIDDQPSAICNMSANFRCVRQALDSTLKAARSCNCTVPCTRKIYEPSLSYGLLSRFNIERTVLAESRHPYVEVVSLSTSERFLDAMDTSQKVDVQTFRADKKQLAEISNSLSLLDTSLETVAAAFGGDNASVSDITNVLSKMKHALGEDRALMATFWDHNNSSLDNATLRLDALKEIIGDVAREYGVDLVISTGAQPQADEMDICRGSLSFPRNLTQYIMYTEDVPHTYMSCDDTFDRNCDRWLCDFLREVTYVTEEAEEASNITWKFGYNYTQLIDSIFDTSLVDPFAMPEHEECLSGIERVLGGEFGDNVTMLVQLLKETLLAESIDQLYELTWQVHNLLSGSVLQNTRYTMDNLNRTCAWFYKHAPISLKSRMADTWMKAEDSLEMVHVYFLSLPKLAGTIRQALNTNLAPSLSFINHYLENNFTKLALHSQLQSFRLQKALDDVQSLVLDYEETHGRLIASVDSTDAKVSTAFYDTYSIPVPIINNDRLKQMNWITLLVNYSSAPGLLQSRTPVSAGVLIPLSGDFIRNQINAPTKNLKDAVSGNMTQLITHISDYKAALDVYASKCRMDENFFAQNFMQVDIFYKELKYERVTQRPAFPALSLLSEVGGFLGLLLGASVLTVCELLDFLGMTCLEKVKAGSLKKSSGTP